jgi:hypothetical protein
MSCFLPSKTTIPTMPTATIRNLVYPRSEFECDQKTLPETGLPGAGRSLLVASSVSPTAVVLTVLAFLDIKQL